MSSGQKKADAILNDHPSYESIDRLGNRWYHGRYRPGIREWGYPVRLPVEEWGKLAKMRGGFEERPLQPFRRTLNGEAKQRPSQNDRREQTGYDAYERNIRGSDATPFIR
jgi:hypothetical protein